MKNSSSIGRRKWLKNSFLSAAALPFLLPDLQSTLLEEASASEKKLNAISPSNEGYWEQVKRQFLIDPDLYYFNNASIGPCPEMVLNATNQFRTTVETFPSKYMWGGWTDEKELVREKAATLLKVSTEEIAIIHNTTEGMNLIAASMQLEAGDEVILADHEHHTGTIPWIHYQESKGVKLVRPKLNVLPESKAELVEIYRRAITPKTKVISLVHITNTNGMILPIKEISEMAHEKGILVAVDGAQSIGMIDFDLDELGCDFYAGSCHKWLFSPKGLGIFYARKNSQQYLKPFIVCGGYKDKSIRRLGKLQYQKFT